MAKDNVSSWDANPDNNTDVGGNNIAEGCPPAGINNAIRAVMAQVRSWYSNVPRLDAANTFTGANTFNGSVALATPLAPSNGGTGTTTTAAFISSLGLTVPISLDNGGTGTTTAAGARTNLGLGSVAVLNTNDLRTIFASYGVDEVGAVCLLSRITAGTFDQGDTSLGSQLRWTNASGSFISATSPGGTWRCLGCATGGGGPNSITLWKRIA